MSTQNTALNTGNQATSNYDVSKIFVFNNRYNTGTIINSKYTPETLPAGTVLGRIAGTGNLTPCVSTATDGSQFPMGILAADIVIAFGASMNVPVCIFGDVVQSKVVFFNTSDNLNTVVNGRTMYDRIGSDSVGIKLVASTENTYLDNQ